MSKLAKFQMCSLLCVAVLVPSVFLSCFLGSGLTAFLVTVSVLVLSSGFLSRKKKKEVTLDENTVQEENPISDKVENFLGNDQVGEKIEEKKQALMESNVPENEDAAQENLVSDQVGGEKMHALTENVIENEAAAQENPVSGEVTDFLGNYQVDEKIEEKIPSVMENEAVRERKVVGFVNEPDFHFLSETGSSTSDDGENFELDSLDWMCYKNNAAHQNQVAMMMMKKMMISSGSDSVSVSSESESEDGDGDGDGDGDEEEGLIEISIPEGNEEEPNKQKHDQEYSIDVKQQAGLIDSMAADSDSDSDFNEAALNEEENLIEIDISMGSIKCSRFQIEA